MVVGIIMKSSFYKQYEEWLGADKKPREIIIQLLKENQVDDAIEALCIYLTGIHKKQYEFLIVDLIKISLMEHDMTFSKIETVLTHIEKGTFEFQIAEYIQLFYLALTQKKYHEARIYLDIISKSKILGQEIVFFSELEKMLNQTEKNENQNTANEVPILESNQNNPMISLLSLLKENGIVLLKIEKWKQVQEMVKKCPNVESFCIGSNDDRRMVLRWKSNTKEFINIKELLQLAQVAYRNGEYDSCIPIYRQLLELRKPPAFVYARLGLSYLKQSNQELAIDYLTVATDLSRQECGLFDFSEMIDRIRGKRVYKKRVHIKMSALEFADNREEYYGIAMEPIVQLISKGHSLEEACQMLNFTEEQKNVVLLIFAKEHYTLGEFAFGDQCMKKVERSKNKSKQVIDLWRSIQKNKQFYQNRIGEDYKSFMLKR